MPAVCTSPHDVSCIAPKATTAATPPPASPPPGAKGDTNPLTRAMAAMHHLLHGVDRLLPFNAIRIPSAAPSASAAPNRLTLLERQRLARAQTYMAARLAGRNADVLKLVSEDVVLKSSRDGVIRGKGNFREYIDRVKGKGSWRKPTWNRSIGVAEVEGNVRILMVNVNVFAQFGFDRQGKIARININTGKKPHS